jgi:hypothetical protein
MMPGYDDMPMDTAEEIATGFARDFPKRQALEMMRWFTEEYQRLAAASRHRAESESPEPHEAPFMSTAEARWYERLAATMENAIKLIA